jgi:hypothetical protein
VHLAADLGLEAVDDEVERRGAAGVHVDEELVLLLVAPRRTRLDVGQVDALLLLVPQECDIRQRRRVFCFHTLTVASLSSYALLILVFVCYFCFINN